MEDWKKIDEMRKLEEIFGIKEEDLYEYLERRDDVHLEYETSKFLDKREKNGIG